MRVMTSRPFAAAVDTLRGAGLRPTRQRLSLARLLFDGADRHVTAEQLHSQAERDGVRVSLATVYNTLHQFTDAGLLREVVVEAGRSYFDTNTQGHHHFFEAETGRLIDIPADQVSIGSLPSAPPGAEIERVDLIVRVRKAAG
ncbi:MULTISPECIES: iron response transcriptional regulator IrrA [Thalassobaculum]|nr:MULTISPECIES: Fur family transcriptional regulator [Thalassobaculum]